MNVRLKAPRSWGSTSMAAASTERSGSGGDQRGDQVGVVGGDERARPRRRRRPCAASSAVFTRLPLWHSARPVPASVVRKVGWAFSQVEAPVVE